MLREIETAYVKAADAQEAIGMSAYMRDQFPFLGIKKPVRAKLNAPFLAAAKKLSAAELKSLVQKVWNKKEREFQYLALELLEKTPKQWDDSFIELLEHFIVDKSWWDTVDTVSGRLMYRYFERFPKRKNAFAKKWCASKNFWLNRCAILFQMKLKANTDTALLSDCILPHLGSDEFFIQKAIGWVLRDYAYHNEKWVRHFVATHPLKPLSKREAMKHL